jgi:hypothetical protein
VRVFSFGEFLLVTEKKKEKKERKRKEKKRVDT